jgi:hypothetical protein
VPTPPAQKLDQLFCESLERYFRSLRLRYHFGIRIKDLLPSSSPSRLSDPFRHLRLPSKFNLQQVNNVAIEEYISRTQKLFGEIRLSHLIRRNLPRNSLSLIKKMSAHPDLVFKPADKNLGITILRRDWYETEMKRQLADTSTYKLAPFSSFSLMNIKSKIENILRSKVFSVSVKKFIWENPDIKPRACAFYGLPKIHKLKPDLDLNQMLQKLTCRPIVSCPSFITTPLSKWVDAVLQPLVIELPTVVKDSKSFINIIESFTVPPHLRDSCVLLTADISSLYTMIPTDDGIRKMEKFLRRPKSRD